MDDINYIEQYFNKTSKAISALHLHKQNILIIKEIEDRYKNKNKIVAGNGGHVRC